MSDAAVGHLARRFHVDFNHTMGLELCPTCGDEHEPPRGLKCKRAKLAKKSFKPEPLEMSEEYFEGAERLEKSTPGLESRKLRERQVVKEAPQVAVIQDDEERTLRAQLEQRACERRKRQLRAALEAPSASDEEKNAVGRPERARARSRRKQRRNQMKTQARSTSSGCKTRSASSTSSSSSSSSSSGSRSRRRSKKKHDRKKRSKFAIDNYTKDEKNAKRLNFVELMYAALVWCVKKSEKIGMESDDFRGYLGHLAYMTMHAITNNYNDSAYRGYDKAVREKVKRKGLKCFKMGDQELSLLHFNLDNARLTRDTRRATRPATSHRKVWESNARARGACYAHNFTKGGCIEKECTWEHSCIACKSTSHIISKCPSKKY